VTQCLSNNDDPVVSLSNPSHAYLCTGVTLMKFKLHELSHVDFLSPNHPKLGPASYRTGLIIHWLAGCYPKPGFRFFCFSFCTSV